ncbi:sal-like protein 2 [Anopheles nili]|uniref:sal-like protein 2 n=1 Tax=Anopheles nili TaxID=185578 RepID=UPI00237B5A57|nr:sal-like protein 2 [Anopheles nili]
MAGRYDNVQLQNVCRLCLTDASEAGDMLPIFPVRGGNPNSPSSIVNRILQCTSLKLEPTEGVPATICELCSVRLEDWHAFREQCLGTDEYLRVTLRHAFFPHETQEPSPPAAAPVSNDDILRSTSEPSIRGKFSSNSAPSSPPVPMAATPTTGMSRLSLAKRRQSTFEWPVADRTGNLTGQKVIVEVLGECKTPERDGRQEQSFTTGGMIPVSDTIQLEQASWSKEYCARVNSLMLLVSGPRPFKCKLCRRLFKNRTNLRRHIKTSHGDEIVEGESPPPECYDYGHIDRMAGSVLHQQHPQQQQQQRSEMVSYMPPKKKRKSTDPPIVGPFKCEVCPRSFKMPAHLAVHRKTHRQMVFDQPQLVKAMEQEQQRLASEKQRASVAIAPHQPQIETVRPASNIDTSDVIQLSDDEEDEPKLRLGVGGNSEDRDDGFNEDEGSFREGDVMPQIELRPDPSALAIVEIGAEDDEGARTVGHDEDVVVIADAKESLMMGGGGSSPKPAPSVVGRVGSLPPGPLSSKLRYTAQTAESNGNSKQPPGAVRAKHPVVAVKQKAAPLHQPQTPTVQQTGGLPLNGSHRCHFCRQTFPREDLLREHQKTHQRDTPCPFRCGWCRKGFRYQQNYTLHLEKQTCRTLNADPVRGVAQSQTSSLMAEKCI